MIRLSVHPRRTLIILDEPTAALDLFRHIRSLYAGRTVLHAHQVDVAKPDLAGWHED